MTTRGADEVPGSAQSLYVLYRLVPAAEVFDAVDDPRDAEEMTDVVAQADQQSEGYWSVVADTDVEPASDDDAAGVAAVDAGESPMTIGQVLGLLEHVVGARPVPGVGEDDAAPSAPPTDKDDAE